MSLDELAKSITEQALKAGISTEDLQKVFALAAEGLTAEMKKPENSKDPLVRAILEFKGAINPNKITLEVAQSRSSPGGESDYVDRYYSRLVNAGRQKAMDKIATAIAENPNDQNAIDELQQLIQVDFQLPDVMVFLSQHEGRKKIAEIAEASSLSLSELPMFTSYVAHEHNNPDGKVLNDRDIAKINASIVSAQSSLAARLEEKIKTPITPSANGQSGTQKDKPAVETVRDVGIQ